MKNSVLRSMAVILILVLTFSLCACGSSSGPAGKERASGESSAVTFHGPMYSSGASVNTFFGEITVVEAAFCEKAQLIDALPKPAYNTAGDGRIVFAMRTMISNTSDKDLVLFDDLKVTIQYENGGEYRCSKGGNYHSSDPLYKILPAGTSGEYIISGKIPVDTYRSAERFYVDFNGEKLGFSYGEIQVYNSMGYQEGDNAASSMQTIIESAGTAPSGEMLSAPSDTEDIPELSFALEDARIEKKNSSVKIEANIRNTSEYSFVSVVFNGVVLDQNGDILENCGFIYINGLEAGQAGWSFIPIRETETAEKMASVKLITVWYKDDPQAPSHNLRFDLPEPLVIDLNLLK